MAQISVDSLDDNRLAPYRDLPGANLTEFSGRFVVEGKWMVERLAASDYRVESVVVNKHQLELIPAGLAESVPIYVLGHDQIEQLIGFNFHRGILACGLRKAPSKLSEIASRSGPLLLVACVDIHDPTNLGGILRNCAAFGVDGVLLSPRCADPFSRRVLRVSMGTAFKLRIGKLSNPQNELQQLHTEFNCSLFATVLADDAEKLETIVTPERKLLLIGNEGHGLPQQLIDCCDRRVTLQMELATDSLNAAAATAVFLYHFTRIGSSSPSSLSPSSLSPRAREDSAS